MKIGRKEENVTGTKVSVPNFLAELMALLLKGEHTLPYIHDCGTESLLKDKSTTFLLYILTYF